MSFTGYLYTLATDTSTGFIPRVLKSGLLLLSFIYGLLVRVAIYCYTRKPARLACRVISVGNITLGGTGKTALVQAITRLLRDKGHTVAILTRGYKRQTRVSAELSADYRTMGDEAFMMSRKLKGIPVLVDADRVRSARRAIRDFAADTVVLDDGFQQWRIHKDLEIVTLDAKNPFGNRHLIPRGILRQPLSTLARADVFVLTGGADPAQMEAARMSLKRMNPRAVIVHARHVLKRVYRLASGENTVPEDSLHGKAAALFCGIGNPESFRSTVAEAGVNVRQVMVFADHYPYTEEDVEGIFKRSKAAGCELLMTTEKDAVRIPLAARKRFGPDILIAAAELTIDDEEKRFIDRLLSVYPA